MEKMKLYFDENIKEVFLKKIVTPKLRGEIAEIIVKFQENDNTKLITRTLEIIKKFIEIRFRHSHINSSRNSYKFIQKFI